MTAELFQERNRETPGGAVITSECVARHKIGLDAVWMLWRDSVGPHALGTRIELAIRTPASGWRTWSEPLGFPRDDCPLAFLDRAAAVDRDWRDQVWIWHEKQLAADAERSDGPLAEAR